MKNNPRHNVPIKYFNSSTIELSAPFLWLQKGWEDLCKIPYLSCFIGLCFSLLILTASYIVFRFGALMILPSCIFLAWVTPLLTYLLYHISWSMTQGHTPSLFMFCIVLKRYLIQSTWVAVLLSIILLFWMRIEGILYALYPESTPTWQNLMLFLTVGSFIGALLAAITFMLLVFTPQILMEHDVDLVTALYSSLKAIQKNKLVMCLWACLIGSGLMLGLVTLGFAFIILMPLYSYASWHAYQGALNMNANTEQGVCA
tara:strand:- start:13132 stop:13905 length:774 start_codon:yes stop_codon:yes gene_type:complete